MLRRQFSTHISKRRIAYNDDFIDLQDYQVETLRANDRKAWLKAHPLEAAIVPLITNINTGDITIK